MSRFLAGLKIGATSRIEGFLTPRSPEGINMDEFLTFTVLGAIIFGFGFIYYADNFQPHKTPKKEAFIAYLLAIRWLIKVTCIVILSLIGIAVACFLLYWASGWFEEQTTTKKVVIGCSLAFSYWLWVFNSACQKIINKLDEIRHGTRSMVLSHIDDIINGP